MSAKQYCLIKKRGPHSLQCIASIINPPIRCLFDDAVIIIFSDLRTAAFDFQVVKKLLASLDLKPSKVKLIHKGPCFISFRSSEDRDQAVAKLNGHVFKGLTLKVRVARPAADPVLLKRAQEADEACNTPAEKRAKIDETQPESSPIQVNHLDSVAPLWRLAYDPDQIQAKQKTALSHLAKLRSAVRKVNTFRHCDTCLRSGLMSSKSVPLTEAFCPINRSPVETGYRNKAEFTIGQDGPVVGCRLGKYCKGSTRVASPSGLPIFSDSILRVVCHLQGLLDFISNPEAFPDHPFVVSPPARALSETSEGEEKQTSLKDRALALSRKLRTYDLVARSGHWSSAMVRETRLNDRLLRVELHRDNLTDTLTELCCGLKFAISMDAFFQVTASTIPRISEALASRRLYKPWFLNTPAAEILYKVIKEQCLSLFAPPKASEAPATKIQKIDAVLLDICCGTGTIGLCLTESFESVVGIELVPAAVENAKHNAELNGMTNAKFLAGRAELLLNDAIRGLAPDKKIVAILDPPRAGVREFVLSYIACLVRLLF
ncbi:unnamed protein product [Dibothriocephalus latus]|uniref:tRNA (uracil(54)-C(5))-methyltransferase n=1 Tax=Dibothriocephalus latus TaxID=60516 RepID=A0A3P6NXX9_DIBLA|nr:unnamed protein product [Dibothriocephalus latus]